MNQAAVFVAPMSGGEARRLTACSPFVGRLAWTPDGREILGPRTTAPAACRCFGFHGAEAHQRQWLVSPLASTWCRSRICGPATPSVWPLGMANQIRASADRSRRAVSRNDPGLDAVQRRHPHRRGRAILAGRDSSGVHVRPYRESTDLGGRPHESGSPALDHARRRLRQRRLVVAGWPLARPGRGRRRQRRHLRGERRWRAAQRLTNAPARESDPEWSRDGRWIYYASTLQGNRKSGGCRQRVERQSSSPARRRRASRGVRRSDHLLRR